jgi:hypothetical protein
MLGPHSFDGLFDLRFCGSIQTSEAKHFQKCVFKPVELSKRGTHKVIKMIWIVIIINKNVRKFIFRNESQPEDSGTSRFREDGISAHGIGRAQPAVLLGFQELGAIHDGLVLLGFQELGAIHDGLPQKKVDSD